MKKNTTFSPAESIGISVDNLNSLVLIVPIVLYAIFIKLTGNVLHIYQTFVLKNICFNIIPKNIKYHLKRNPFPQLLKKTKMAKNSLNYLNYVTLVERLVFRYLSRYAKITSYSEFYPSVSDKYKERGEFKSTNLSTLSTPLHGQQQIAPGNGRRNLYTTHTSPYIIILSTTDPYGILLSICNGTYMIICTTTERTIIIRTIARKYVESMRLTFQCIVRFQIKPIKLISNVTTVADYRVSRDYIVINIVEHYNLFDEIPKRQTSDHSEKSRIHKVLSHTDTLFVDHSEQSDECIDFTMIFEKNLEKQKNVTEKREFLRKTSFIPNRFFIWFVYISNLYEICRNRENLQLILKLKNHKICCVYN
ncbi:hypothetical protein AGLY_008807 [Aphis glycines]|uniref:Uncharacterized protein n=1 Tax=Aphis glycines TaxID=307491 RepID=A0A6G0TLV8_APHGL|nr:hypothetical protein AGLY_008807 [Aphis glycines]